MTWIDWAVVAFVIGISIAAGVWVVRFSSRHGAESYFTSDRNLPWWVVAVSNTATYHSGTGPFVMLIVTFGLAANWMWWASWIIWMPLVAIVWAPLWRRMRIMTTAELIGLRYGGRPANIARKAYALVCCFGFAVLLIGYITGFFAKTIAPVVNMSELQILLIFGGSTALYTMFGGLMGVVVTEILHFGILLVGCVAFWLLAMSQHGGWGRILERIAATRPEALAQIPPVVSAAPATSIELLTIAVLVLQGFFFAGSPTAGEGLTAQRFMAAKSERHAMAGQLFNCFLALTLRIAAADRHRPGCAVGLLAGRPGGEGPGPRRHDGHQDPVYAWAELIKRCRLPVGFLGLLISVEAAAYTSTLSALVNWGSSFVVNDLYRPLDPGARRGAKSG